CLSARLRHQRDRLFQRRHGGDAAPGRSRQPWPRLDGQSPGGLCMSEPSAKRASAGRHLAIATTLVVLLLPFLWLLQMSFKTNDQILQFPPPLIFTPTLSNYASLWHSAFTD